MMRTAAVILLVLGLMQMAGDVFQVPALRGLGAASAASPAPKVFSAVRGLETHSTRFFVEWLDSDGQRQSLEITPEVNARLKGPYNRRNVYGAALAFGPVLPAELRDPVMRYSLCGKMWLLSELGIDTRSVSGGVRVRYEPLPGTDMSSLPRILEAPCP